MLGFPLLGLPGETPLAGAQKTGKASRFIMPRKAASMTVVVRLHHLSRPLRKIMARRGELM